MDYTQIAPLYAFSTGALSSLNVRRTSSAIAWALRQLLSETNDHELAYSLPAYLAWTARNANRLPGNRARPVVFTMALPDRLVCLNLSVTSAVVLEKKDMAPHEIVASYGRLLDCLPAVMPEETARLQVLHEEMENAYLVAAHHWARQVRGQDPQPAYDEDYVDRTLFGPARAALAIPPPQ
jgi:hypothetical protein